VPPPGDSFLFAILANPLAVNRSYVQTAPVVSNVSVLERLLSTPRQPTFVTAGKPSIKVFYDLDRAATVEMTVTAVSTPRVQFRQVKANDFRGHASRSSDGAHKDGVLVDRGDYRVTCRRSILPELDPSFMARSCGWITDDALEAIYAAVSDLGARRRPLRRSAGAAPLDSERYGALSVATAAARRTHLAGVGSSADAVRGDGAVGRFETTRMSSSLSRRASRSGRPLSRRAPRARAEIERLSARYPRRDRGRRNEPVALAAPATPARVRARRGGDARGDRACERRGRAMHLPGTRTTTR
jgi:hypothetical protein